MTITVSQKFGGAEVEVSAHELGFERASRFVTLRGIHPALAQIVGIPVRHVMIERTSAPEPGL